MPKYQAPPDVLGEIFAARATAPAGPAPELIPLAKVRRDGATQPRAGLSEDHVADLLRALSEGEKLPPVDVMYDGTAYWLYDGYHRSAAHERAGRTEIAAIVHQGGQADAQWESYAANKAHGLKRTNDDKKRQVLAALRHPNAPNLSNREIARHVGVDEATIRTYRAQLETTAEIPQSETRKGGDGRTINTARIGKTPTKAERAAALVPDVLEYARAYRDAYGRTAADLDPGSAAHTNSRFWSDITKAWKNKAIHEDVLKAAIKVAIDLLAQEKRALAPAASSEQRQYESAARSAFGVAAAIQSDVRSILSEPPPPADLDGEPVPVLEVTDGLLYQVACEANSAGKVSSGKIEKPFLYNGFFWTCVSSSHGGFRPEMNEAACVRLHAQGTPIAPGVRINRFTPDAYLPGTPVKYQSIQYVLGAQWMIVRRGLAAPAPTSENPKSAPAPDAIPADLAACGWTLRQVPGSGRWYANNPNGPRATGVFDRPGDAVEAAYGMQVNVCKPEPEPVAEPEPEPEDDGSIALMWNLRTAQGVLENMVTYWSDAKKFSIDFRRDPNSSTRLTVTLCVMTPNDQYVTFQGTTLEEAVRKAERVL
jgi:hypothetical protein